MYYFTLPLPTADPAEESTGPAAKFTFKYHTRNIQGQDGGAEQGYWFAVVGTAGETAEHDCVGDKTKGTSGSCTFEDNAEIGEVTGVRIGNGYNDNWRFTKMALSVEGVDQPTFYGYASVEAFQTITVAFDKGKVLNMAYHLYVILAFLLMDRK